jgi:hypothetical protein
MSGQALATSIFKINIINVLYILIYDLENGLNIKSWKVKVNIFKYMTPARQRLDKHCPKFGRVHC